MQQDNQNWHINIYIYWYRIVALVYTNKSKWPLFFFKEKEIMKKGLKPVIEHSEPTNTVIHTNVINCKNSRCILLVDSLRCCRLYRSTCYCQFLRAVVCRMGTVGWCCSPWLVRILPLVLPGQMLYCRLVVDAVIGSSRSICHIRWSWAVGGC